MDYGNPPDLCEQWLGEFKKALHPNKFDTGRTIESPRIMRLNKLSAEGMFAEICRYD